MTLQESLRKCRGKSKGRLQVGVDAGVGKVTGRDSQGGQFFLPICLIVVERIRVQRMGRSKRILVAVVI